MLKPAKQYEPELQQLLYETIDDPYYNWYYPTTVFFNKELVTDDTWVLQYVSVHPETNKVIGYFGCDLNIHAKYASGLEVVNYTQKPSRIFYRDLMKFIQKIKNRGMNSITSSVSEENKNWSSTLKKTKLYKLGLTVSYIGTYLNTHISRQGGISHENIYQMTFINTI